METPSNPTLKVTDIKAVADIVHAQPGVFLVVDNTFESAYFQVISNLLIYPNIKNMSLTTLNFQRPLELGADIAYYSLTKYMNGHTDVIMGSIALNDSDLHNRIRFLQNAIGPVPSPFDCFLVNRSLKTLKIRMEEHQKNALVVGEFLEKHPCVESIRHPGMPSHPQHDLVKKQQYGHSGMISFYLKGKLPESRKFLSQLQLVTLAESLGGYESLAELPYLMTHASIAEEERVALGVTDNLIRVSVGLENPEDIIKDLDQALRFACNA